MPRESDGTRRDVGSAAAGVVGSMAATRGGPGRRWWARPDGLVEQTRWLYCLLVLLSAVLLVPAIAHSGSALASAGFGTSVLLLAALWVRRCATRTATPAGDLAEAALLGAAVALASPPMLVFGFAFPALWFRAVYGSSRRVLVHCALVVAGITGGLQLWHLVPGHDGAVPAAAVLGCLPLAFVTSVGARHLANALFAREQGQQRDAVLSELGRDLFTATDRQQILDLGERAARDVSRVTPGLASALVDATADGAVVRIAIGAWERELPAVLPDVLLPERPPADAQPRAFSAPSLDACAGRPGRWTAMPDPTRSGSWLISGAPDRTAAEGVPAMHTAFTQVALALVTSEAHRALREQACTDALTGLANRAAFTEALQRAASAPETRFSVAFVDLDDFKRVNDARGHAAGDELLRTVAVRLRAAVREADVCARLGGDEFAVLMHETDGANAGALAQRLVAAVAEPVALPGGPAQVGASIGVAHRASGEDAEQVVQHADVSMYAAKAAGKNQVRVFAA